MPQVIDATVVNQAYGTSGNGGRKLVMLDNGWLVAVAKIDDYMYFYADKQDGNGFAQLCYYSGTSLNTFDVAIVAKGTKVYVLNSYADGAVHTWVIDAETVANENIQGGNGFYVLDNNQSALGNVSLAINESGTELHAAWSSKNSSYPNSFNIRYAKGTINPDGSVTWGAVEQVTATNSSGYDNKNPTIQTYEGKPIVIFDRPYNSGNRIIAVSKGLGWLSESPTVMSSGWDARLIYEGNSYAQSSPSAIFVPQSINGLANGRIWVAWHGKDATDTAVNNIRLSYSDDGGVTWSAMQKLTSGNAYDQHNASITASKNGSVFIVYNAGTTSPNIRMLVPDATNTSWSIDYPTGGAETGKNPSALYDPNLKYTEPLYVYSNASKVGFYGSWSTIEISQPPGHLGEFTESSALLTYNITTEEALDTITEKVNGVTIGTRNAPVSGQDYTVSLTQAQWDAVRFGKYSGKNMLPPFRYWAIDDQASITGDYSLELNATASTQYTSYIVDVEPNADYTLSVTQTGADARVQVRSVDRSQVLANTIGEGLQTATFNTGSLTQVQVEMSNVAAGTFTFDNPQLEKGTSATSFEEAGRNNTLEITMGDNTWSYTFDKRPANDADILSAVKAVKDSQEVHLPNIKRQLVDKVGGSVADSFEEIIGGAVLGRKMASGTATSGGSAAFYQYAGSTSTVSRYSISVTGLSFKPSIIYAVGFQSTSNIRISIYSDSNDGVYDKTVKLTTVSSATSTQTVENIKGDTVSTDSGFSLPVVANGIEYKWYAYE